MMWSWYGPGWWMVFGGILFVLFWAAVIALAVWGIRKIARTPGPSTPGGRTAMDILKERYARGEITKEQFDQMKRDLES